MVAGAIAISTAAPYLGYAAIGAAIDNNQNIACIDDTTQYFVSKSITIMAVYVAVIVLISSCGIGVGDGESCGNGDGCADDGIG